MRVLVTGAGGRIGQRFATEELDDGLELVLTDVGDPPSGSRWSSTTLDVTDPAACAAACRDVDAVLHLAADPSPQADFHAAVLPINMVGTYHLASAAVAAGVSRFVFASSAQAVAGYPPDHQVRETDAPWPRNDYGVGKAFGEALCGSLSVTSSTGFVSVRIGNYADTAPGPEASWRDRAAWVSPRDANQLLRRSLMVPVRDHLVVHGVSDNASKLLSLQATIAAVGYRPVDDAFAVA